MNEDPSRPRGLQQQPQRESDAQQQRAGSTDFQSPEAQDRVEGEGSYSASRDYQKDIKEYMEKADIAANAEAAKPRSESEAREMEEAEREGKSHSKAKDER